MFNTQQNFLDGPIPGQSLTAELGNRPWQNPPQYTTVEEALEFYIPRLVEPAFVGDLINVMETGVPLTTIANAMQLGGVMQGHHTVDVGVLVIPVLIEMMAYLGDDAGIQYNTGMEEAPQSDTPKDTAIAVAVKRAKEKIDAMDMPEEKTVTEQDEPDKTGLMARRQ